MINPIRFIKEQFIDEATEPPQRYGNILIHDEGDVFGLEAAPYLPWPHNSGMRNTSSGVGLALATETRYAKCPYCGNRQDMEKYGANCIRCNGDVTNKAVT